MINDDLWQFIINTVFILISTLALLKHTTPFLGISAPLTFLEWGALATRFSNGTCTCSHSVHVHGVCLHFAGKKAQIYLEDLIYLGIILKCHNNKNKVGFECIDLHVRVARCLHIVYV